MTSDRVPEGRVEGTFGDREATNAAGFDGEGRLDGTS